MRPALFCKCRKYRVGLGGTPHPPPPYCNIAVSSGNFDNFNDTLVGQKYAIEQNILHNFNINQDYHQIPLYPDSKRLNFGLSCAAEIFQKKVSDAIRGTLCVKNISDDVIYIGGIDNDNHDRRLEQWFQELQDNGLTIKLPKCQFRVPTIWSRVFRKRNAPCSLKS